MTKLRVGIFVKAARGRHAEVSPDIFVGLEVELLDGAGTGLEPLVGVLGSYPGGNHVANGFWNWPFCVSEVNWVHRITTDSEHAPDSFDPVKGDPEGDH